VNAGVAAPYLLSITTVVGDQNCLPMCCRRPDFTLAMATHDYSLLAADPIELPHDLVSAAEAQVAAAPAEPSQCGGKFVNRVAGCPRHRQMILKFDEELKSGMLIWL